MNITTTYSHLATYDVASTAKTSPDISQGGNTLPSGINSDIQISDKGKSFQTLAQGIMQKYDLNNITPRDMATMSSELYSSGVISFEEHAMISFQPELNTSQPAKFGSPDTPRDFIQDWESRLELQKQYRAPKEFIEKTEHTLNLLKNLNSLSTA